MTAQHQACERLLLVEDDRDIREAMQDLLEDAGYHVNVAANGKEALSLLSSLARPCLILLDLMMPVMSGEEFLGELREKEGLAPIPVVIVSAWAREAAKENRVQGFVSKPVDPERLLLVVRKFCRAPRPAE